MPTINMHDDIYYTQLCALTGTREPADQLIALLGMGFTDAPGVALSVRIRRFARRDERGCVAYYGVRGVSVSIGACAALGLDLVDPPAQLH